MTSDPDSEAYPSTVKQWDLLRLLASELKEIVGASQHTLRPCNVHGNVLQSYQYTDQHSNKHTN